MRAYKCDGCQEYRNGEPLFVIVPTFSDIAMPEEFHCCAWSCIEKLATRERQT